MDTCLYCRAIEYRFYQESEGVVAAFNLGPFLHHDNCQALERSAGDGCPMCRVLLEAITRYCVEAGKTDQEGRPVYPPGVIELGMVSVSGLCPVWVGSPRLGRSGKVRAIQLPNDWRDPWEDANGDLVKVSVAMLSMWISICEAQHPGCSSIAPDVSFKPTRLIDVGQQDGKTVRLLDTSAADIPSAASYVALSHCWGLSMPGTAKTLKSTQCKHLEVIRLDDLSKTFVDAINTTRHLHVPFIWIDSLCIIQDSREDWEREAAQMASIYSHARVTLAASGSSDGTQGCRLGELGREIFWPYVDFTTPGGKRFRLCSWSDANDEVVVRDPLQQRGWTLQERELSPRIAHFSRDSLRWECRCLQASLHFPWGDSLAFVGNRRAFDSNAPPDKLERNQASSNDTVDRERPTFTPKEWHRLVQLYTRRLLTHQTDVLPAISGIARAVSLFTPWEYHAGHFVQHGLVGLLWGVDPKGTSTFAGMSGARSPCRPTQYTAPSWSWASVNGAIRWGHDQSDEDLAQIVHISTTPLFTDPWGQLKTGILEIKGPLIQMQTKLARGPSGPPTEGIGIDRDVFAAVRGSIIKVGAVRFDVEDEVADLVYGLACAKMGGQWPQTFGIALVLVPGGTSTEERFR